LSCDGLACDVATSVVVVHRGLFFQPRLAYSQLTIVQFRLKQDTLCRFLH
jgi:hypothetical protein